MGLHGEEGSRGSGDAITLAIKDIKEAIEEVKTKTIRSPYTPDKPVGPIWVMRQEVSPTEDAYPLQTTAGHVSMTSHIMMFTVFVCIEMYNSTKTYCSGFDSSVADFLP